MLSFQQAVSTDLDRVNTLIVERLQSEVNLVENIGQYIVDSGGKRLRPILVLLTCKALDYQGSQHIDLATIIEFIHTATLLHDDVVDLSNLRRGKPTANAKFGNAPSVLVGDFLYSRSFQMLVGLKDMEIMSILSNTTNVIAEGEVQQLVNARNPDLDEQGYFAVIHKKTAALFEAACSTAAVLSHSSAALKESARAYGYHLGTAFQIIDDALDYEGDSDALGKNIGDDLAEGKATLPLIQAMNCSNDSDRQLIRDAIEGGGIDHLNKIINIVKTSGAIEYCKLKASEHADLAIASAQNIPDNTYKQAMIDLAQFSITRSY